MGRTATVRRASPRSLLFPRAPTSVRQGRRLLGADLAAATVDEELSADAQAILSELMSNAIKYARPLVDDHIKVVWVVRGDQIEVRVTDGGGPHVPTVRHPDATDTGGRGLALVEGLADSWGVDRTNETATVWAVLALP